MNKDKKIPSENKEFLPPKFADAVQGSNNYGLDTSDLDYIQYTYENIVIEVIGGINDIILSTLRLSLKIYKVGSISPLEIYRSSHIDVFNEQQVNYAITKTCEKLKIETLRFKNIFFDFIERIDNFRRNGKQEHKVPVFRIPTAIKQEALTILQSENILEHIEDLMQDAGMSDTGLSMQLFLTNISRITNKPLHSIVIAPKYLGHALIQEIIEIIPKEHLRECTSISKHALSYPPREDYWNNKTLVLHQLESISEKGNTLLEYIQQGQSRRLVTQSDSKTGNYQSQKKDITGTIHVMSYTSKEYHPIFSGKQTICIPLQNKNEIENKLYEREVKELAGLWGTDIKERTNHLLTQLQRELENLSIYNPIIEQVDLKIFFGTNIKALSQYLQLVNIVTLLHQHNQDIRITKTKKIIEVKAAYMIYVLKLFRSVWLKKDDELAFNTRSTFNRLKKYLEEQDKANYKTKTFQLKEVRKALHKAPVTMQRHLKTLELYGKIARCGGNNKTGYEYIIIEWNEQYSKVEAFEKLIKNLELP